MTAADEIDQVVAGHRRAMAGLREELDSAGERAAMRSRRMVVPSIGDDSRSVPVQEDIAEPQVEPQLEPDDYLPRSWLI
ncbi:MULTISPECIES: hypothetical protein [Antrihabitans]|uniref:Uncharacterized protein n=2 Tax=Antrihabitans TaxID=2799491 RepID=A0A934NNM9_9NOCA|nr:hypothetical protein [Antrihabitans stalagmiti]MBJ8338558.1 hypothetical protein [Antrihabitans stalagmiti]